MPTKENKITRSIITTLLILCVYCLSFMILDRTLSIYYGFNFQPYGDYAPTGFPVWGHFLNGSAAALGAFLVFKLYDYGEKKGKFYISALSILFLLLIGAVIPYSNDIEHLIKNGAESTVVSYVIFNDLYVLFWGVLMYRISKTNQGKLLVLGILLIVFLCIHHFLYLPRFPEFYWW